MKQSTLKKILVLAVIMLCGSVLLQTNYIASFSSSKSAVISPVFYQDGSIEYNLHIDIPPVYRPIVRNELFEDWVLKFPNMFDCNSTDNEICENYIGKYIFPEFSNEKNPSLTFYMRTSSMDLLEMGANQFHENVIKVNLQPYIREYKLRIGGAKMGFRFVSDSFERGCRREKTISSNLFQLRDLTSEEKIADEAPSVVVNQPDCYSKNKNDTKVLDSTGNVVLSLGSPQLQSTKYILIDNFGKPVGNGSCLGDKAFSCGFFFWLPQKRQAYVTFSSKNLQKTTIIYEKIVKLLSDITVLDKSTNLEWALQNK